MPPRILLLVLIPVVLLALIPGQSAIAQAPLKPVETHELHNVWQLSPRIVSGSEPNGERALAELARLGVKTIVSVDGIAPPVELAKKYGMRYVHVPIGYDGIDAAAQGSLTRVAQEIGGTIYIHCHHGKHRGPAAAAIVCRADDGRSAEAARAILEKAGTGKEYPGLWRDVERFTKPTGTLPALRERAEVESLASAMARIDRTFDRLKLLGNAKWQTVPEQPDLVARNEAVQLVELFTESARVAQPGDLRNGLQQSVELSDKLRQALASGDTLQADKLLPQLTSQCAACHKAHRN